MTIKKVHLVDYQHVIVRVEDVADFDAKFMLGDVFGVTAYNADRDVWQVGVALNPREVLNISDCDDPSPGAREEKVEDSPSAVEQANHDKQVEE
jgi:hypothetical protein